MPSRESDHDRQRFDLSGATALGDAIAAARRFGQDQGLGSRDQARLSIIVEELIANMFEHGRPRPQPRLRLELGRSVSAVTIVIEDNGSPFDPRQAPSVTDLWERGGGAGLRLVAAWSDVVSYASEDGLNRLELKMPLAGN